MKKRTKLKVNSLGIAVKDVNNLKKRFWRICREVLSILDKEEGQ